MGRNERIGLLAAAVVVLALAFLLLRGGDSGDGEDRDVAATPAQTQTLSGTATEPSTTGTAPAAPPAPRVEPIRIRDGRPVGAPRTLEYESGETVRLRFRSNAASEIHIHGYDRYVDVPAGGSASARFRADAEGVFEIEDHGTGQLLAKLEVRP